MYNLTCMRRAFASETGLWKTLVESIQAHPSHAAVVTLACKSINALLEGNQDDAREDVERLAERGLRGRVAELRQRVTAAAKSGVVSAVLSALAHADIRSDAVACANCTNVLLRLVGKHPYSGNVDYGGARPDGSDAAFLSSIEEASSKEATFATIAQLLQSCPTEHCRMNTTSGWLQVSAGTMLLWLLLMPCYEWSTHSRASARRAGLDASLISIMAGYESSSDKEGIKEFLAPQRMLRLCLREFVDSEPAQAALVSAGAESSWFVPPPTELATETGLPLLRAVIDKARG